MTGEIKNMLYEEIKAVLEELKQEDPASEEYKRISDHLNTLYRLRIEEEKLKLDESMKLDERFDGNKAREMEERLKIMEYRELANDRRTKIFISVIEVGVPLVFYAWWVNEGLTFEKNGTFCSFTLRNLFSRFKPNK